MVVSEELKLLRKCKKKVGGSGRGRWRRLVRVVVHRELKLLWKHIKKVGGSGRGRGEVGQGGGEQRIEVIVEIQKKSGRGWGPGPVGGLGSGWL